MTKETVVHVHQSYCSVCRDDDSPPFRVVLQVVDPTKYEVWCEDCWRLVMTAAAASLNGQTFVVVGSDAQVPNVNGDARANVQPDASW